MTIEKFLYLLTIISIIITWIIGLSYIPLVRKWLVSKGLTKRHSKETALNDLWLCKDIGIYYIIIYLKNGSTFISDLNKLNELDLPFKFTKQDADGITIYITEYKLKDENESMFVEKSDLCITYIPNSEIEFINYFIEKKK